MLEYEDEDENENENREPCQLMDQFMDQGVPIFKLCV